MSIRSRSFSGVSLVFLALTLVVADGCGKDVIKRRVSSTGPGSVAAVMETSVTGNWIQDTCAEGAESPPIYRHGIMKFTANQMLTTTEREYDDLGCKVQRPVSIEEIVQAYTIVTPSVTTDGSVWLDIHSTQDPASPIETKAMTKIVNGRLLYTFYGAGEERPKAMDEGRALIFNMM
jgi:hypothetical protein